jgi:DNA invertase Pin-like site-specific DNA recombinase
MLTILAGVATWER